MPEIVIFVIILKLVARHKLVSHLHLTSAFHTKPLSSALAVLLFEYAKYIISKGTQSLATSKLHYDCTIKYYLKRQC